MKTFLQLIKVKHWIKNFFIFAPLIFSLSLFNFDKSLRSLIAFLSFSFVAAFVYILNDINDKERDLKHAIKALRPIASGKIKARTALIIGIIMGIIGLISSFLLGFSSFIIVLIYLILNLFYTYILRNIVILDVIIISIGFCLRVLLGSYSIGVSLSHWMLLTTFAISLILGFGKRRHELELLGTNAHTHRINLQEYSKQFLDMMMIISISLTVISYALYTMSSDVIEKFNTDALIFTVPFVLYGLFRYLLLVHIKGKGGKPVELVITDPGIITTFILWLIVVIGIIYFKDKLKIDIDLVKILKGFFGNFSNVQV